MLIVFCVVTGQLTVQNIQQFFFFMWFVQPPVLLSVLQSAGWTLRSVWSDCVLDIRHWTSIMLIRPELLKIN